MVNYVRTRMKTCSVIGSIEGIDGKLYTLDKDKSNALNRYISSAFTQEDPNTEPVFYIDKSDDVPLLKLLHPLYLIN